MVSLMQFARYVAADGSAIVIATRRIHDEKSLGGKDNKRFVFSRTIPRINVTTVKGFGTPREAQQFFREQASRLEGEGYVRQDWRIVGFHEEG